MSIYLISTVKEIIPVILIPHKNCKIHHHIAKINIYLKERLQRCQASSWPPRNFFFFHVCLFIGWSYWVERGWTFRRSFIREPHHSKKWNIQWLFYFTFLDFNDFNDLMISFYNLYDFSRYGTCSMYVLSALIEKKNCSVLSVFLSFYSWQPPKKANISF